MSASLTLRLAMGGSCLLPAAHLSLRPRSRHSRYGTSGTHSGRMTCGPMANIVTPSNPLEEKLAAIMSHMIHSRQDVPPRLQPKSHFRTVHGMPEATARPLAIYCRPFRQASPFCQPCSHRSACPYSARWQLIRHVAFRGATMLVCPPIHKKWKLLVHAAEQCSAAAIHKNALQEELTSRTDMHRNKSCHPAQKCIASSL
jgi:hypothetical protein